MNLPWCHHVSSWNISTLDAKFPNRNSDEERYLETIPKTPVELCRKLRCMTPLLGGFKFPGRSSSLIQSYGSCLKKGLKSPLFGYPPASGVPDSRPGNPSGKPLRRARHRGGCAECRTTPRWEEPVVLRTAWPNILWVRQCGWGCFYGYNMI